MDERAFAVELPAREIVFGAGSLGRLAELTHKHGWRRLVVFCGRSAETARTVAAVRSGLGPRLIEVFEAAQPHVPEAQMLEGVELVARADADAVIGLGGGSAIGLAKAVSAARRGNAPPDQRLASNRGDGVGVVAVPTTYAGSEMTWTYGVTRPRSNGTRVKVTASDRRIAPQLVIYDPSLTLGLPPGLSAASGINALAHCVEAVYSIRRNPLAVAAALEAAGHIVTALPRCYTAGGDSAARSEMLVGAHLAGFALSMATMGLHHGLCHVLGGTAGIPHGVANVILLTRVMQFNLTACAAELALLAGPLGVRSVGRSDQSAAEAVIQQVEELVRGFDLPRRLREVGLSATDLPGLAAIGLENPTVATNPRPIRAAGELEELLRELW